jgi:hypothetical protein
MTEFDRMQTQFRGSDVGRALDELFLDEAAVEVAGALLVAHAYLMKVGPRNATAASENGQGAAYNATMAAIELQRVVAKFECEYPGARGWEVAQRAIAGVFGASWAETTLSWILRLENAPNCELEPGTPSLVRWALGLPILGGLLPALDTLSQFERSDGEAARAAIEGVRAAITNALSRGVRWQWLAGALSTWARATGGPEIALTPTRVSDRDIAAIG